MANRLSSTLLILAALATPAASQDAPRPRGFTKDGLTTVRDVIRSAIDKGTIPGAVALVLRDGKPALFEALGQADDGRPMTKDAIFRIASMTKPVTSVAVMMLVDEDKLKLDDPVTRFLPEFADLKVIDAKTGETAAPKRAVTVRDLLAHTSGIAYGFSAPERLRKSYADIAEGVGPLDPTLEENVKRLAKIPLAHQPGEAWTYGLNTDVLGRVVEVASGKPLDRFFFDRIFGQLKMADTGFFVPKEKQARLVALYKPDGKKVAKVTEDPFPAGALTVSPKRVLGEQKYHSGGGGLVSTAADYGRFLQMLLNGGELGGVRLLKAESVREMTRNQIGKLDLPFGVHGDKFGLGFGVTTKPGVPSVGSYSWAGAFHTFFWVDPEKKLAGIVMTQLHPWGASTLWADYQKAVYAALENNPAKAGSDAKR
jgi:CubicO group peptidase (beta-lactamase class C family)